MKTTLRKYGQEALINFTLFEADGLNFRVDAVHAVGDSILMKDEGAEASTTNGFVDEGIGYSLSLTATEMEAARLVVYLIDQTATKIWLDKALTIETYGDVNAQHEFDLDSPHNITSGSAAINTIADSFTKSGAEPETNTYLATRELDGVVHLVEDDVGVTDGYYEFNIGGVGVPVGILWSGYAQSNGDDYAIYAYNYSTTTYEQIGNIPGLNNTTIRELSFALTDSHVGSGADLGKVRFRLNSVDGTAFATDRILCSYSVVSKSVGYDGGQVWIDTVNGIAGTESFVNGTADKPSLTLEDATIIASNVGLSSFNLSAGSSVILTQDYVNATAYIYGATLNLNGKDISDTYTWGGIISGIAIGTGPIHLTDSEIKAATLPPVHMHNCSLTDTITAQTAGEYIFSHCYSQIAGAGYPTFDFNAVGNIDLNMRSYSGGIAIDNMNTGDTMSLEGHGQLVINATCSDGAVQLRGHWSVTNNSGGDVTVVYDDITSDVTSLVSEIAIRTPTPTQLAYMTAHAATAKPVTFLDGGSTTEAILDTVDGVAASGINDVYVGRLLVFNSGSLNVQVAEITEYVGATKTATISSVITPVTSSHTAILV